MRRQEMRRGRELLPLRLAAISKALACFETCTSDACLQGCQNYVYSNGKALSLGICGLQNCSLGG